MYRFWSPVYARYLYAATEAEKEAILYEQGPLWTYQCVAWRAWPPQADPNLRPVYRFWSQARAAHYYTISEAERDYGLWTDLSEIWQYQGVAFYAYPAGLQPSGAWPVHRLRSDAAEGHLYTAFEAEREGLTCGDSPAWIYDTVAWYVCPAEPFPAPSIVKGPYLLWPGADSVTVVWQTDVPATGRVEIGRLSPDESLVEDARPVTLHKMALTGLDPDATYLYRLTSGEVPGPTGTFKTAPDTEQSFRFAVHGDTQSSPDVHALVSQAMASNLPDIVFHTGDLVEYGMNYDQWGPGFFTPAAEVTRDIPFVPVPGNHECWGSGPQWFNYFFDSRCPGGWWALTYGAVRFIGLNTNLDHAPGSEQYEWLLSELESPEARKALWRVVFLHYPPYTWTAGHTDAMAVQTDLVPLFEQHAVAAVFSGHSHAYERYASRGICYVVNGGGGAPLYDLVADATVPIREFGASVHHHCIVDVDMDSRVLRLQAVDTEGQVFDRAEIRGGHCPGLAGKEQVGE